MDILPGVPSGHFLTKTASLLADACYGVLAFPFTNENFCSQRTRCKATAHPWNKVL